MRFINFIYLLNFIVYQTSNRFSLWKDIATVCRWNIAVASERLLPYLVSIRSKYSDNSITPKPSCYYKLENYSFVQHLSFP